MNSNLQLTDIRPGMRFSLRNIAHEIAHIDASSMRYASCEGGRPRTMPTSVFWSLVDDKTIGLLGGVTNSAADDEQLWQLTERERLEMHRRFRYVRAALLLGRQPTSATQINMAIQNVSAEAGDRNPPSRSTLAKWIRMYLTSNGSIKSLIPRHARKGRHPYKFGMAIEAFVREKLVSDYLTEQRNSLEQVRCNIVAEKSQISWLKDEPLPSTRSIYRRAAQLDPYVVTLKRFGKKIADAKHSAAGAGILATRPMQYVMMDGHRLDVLVVDEETGEVRGRPFLTCLFDVMTRCVVGWYISMIPFCATTAMAAIKHMCSRNPSHEQGGVPEFLIPDNGPDLASLALRNLCRHVHLTIAPAKKYCPDDKAHIERFFRTLNGIFTHRLPGTTFSSLDDRQDYATEKHACLTLRDVREMFESEFLKTYHTRIHSGTKRVPLLAWRELQETYPIPYYSKDELDVVARIPQRRTINKGRVLIEGMYYKSDALRGLELQGKKDVVVMLDELNLEFVLVQDPTDKKVVYQADSTRPEYTKNLTLFEHNVVRARLRAATKEDLRKLGEYAYEITRYELWNEMQRRKISGTCRKLALLRNKVAESVTGTLPTPLHPNLPLSSEHHADVEMQANTLECNALVTKPALAAPLENCVFKL